MYSYGPPHMAVQKQDDQHEHTFSSYVRIRDVVLKTCLGRWTIGRSGERGSGISVLPARHDDDDISYVNLKANLMLAYLLVEKTYNSKVYVVPRNNLCLFGNHHHHHHHVVPPARISLTISRHFSLSFIASGRSSGLHPVSSHSCCM